MNSKTILMFLLLLIVTAVPASVSAQYESSIIINVTELDNWETYSETHEITVTASHPDGISWIAVIIDGYHVQSEYSSVLTHSWDTTMYSDGLHNIQIRAAVNETFFRAIHFAVFVNNTATPTPTVPDQLNILIKFGALSASAGIFFAVVPFVFFKSDLIERRKHKVVVVIASVSAFSVIGGLIWMFL